MTKTVTQSIFAGALAMAGLSGGASANAGSPAPRAELGYIRVSPEITLRRLVVRNPDARGVVLFLHGFPETLYAWQGVADRLGHDYEIHAFGWPGYGLSSRPLVERFSYAPRDYARVLRDYISAAKIDRTKLIIYATDVGGLPALLAALDEPAIARRIIVGDFAPFNRPQYMHERLQRLKDPSSADQARISLNETRDEVLENAFTRGLPADDSNFTRDEDYLEANLSKLRTPIKVVWGEKDVYINPAMGRELAERTKADFEALPRIGHYAHLQSPAQVAKEIEALFR